MWLKALKIVGTVVAGTIFSPSDEDEDKQNFMDEHNDGLGNINYHGDEYSQQEASDAYDRGEYYR